MAEVERFRTGLGLLFQSHRQALALTQVEAANAAGVSQPTYCDYEAGKVLPSSVVLIKLVSRLQIDPAELLALLDDDDNEPNGKRVAA